MTDSLSPEQRSNLMRRVRTKDTAPEVALRRALWREGVRGWRTDVRKLPGRPDIAWIGLKVAVFVDGAFWHGHPDYYRGQSGPFWDQKIAKNRARDDRVNQELRGMGWRVSRFWDFEIQHELDRCVNTVRDEVNARREKTHGG